MRPFGSDSGFPVVSSRERRGADLFFADLVGGQTSRGGLAAFDALWNEANSPDSEETATVEPGRDDDEIVVLRGDGTRFRVRRKVRAQVLTRPGRPRAGFCRDDERVFFRLSWCEGTQATIDVGANPQGALKDLLRTVIGQINRREGADQIKQTFEAASVQPFVDLDITKVGSWKITGDLKLDINRTGITATTAGVSADRGWVKVGIQYTDDGSGRKVLATADFPLSERKISGRKCPVQELAVWWDVECLREVPTTYPLKSPGSIHKYEVLYVYFDYAKDTLRRDAVGGAVADTVGDILRSTPKVGTARLNKRTLERLDYLVRQGYWLTSVDGYTSPEGRRTPPEAGDRGGAARWEGNDALSMERAEKVLKLIEHRYVRNTMQMRVPRMRFPRGSGMPAAVGKSEYPRLANRIGDELEGAEIDRILILGDKRLTTKPFLVEHPEELARMTFEDQKYVTDKGVPVHRRAARLLENLRRVEIHLTQTERLRGADVPGFYLVHEHDCPEDVVEAAERRWGSRIPFTTPDPPLCDGPEP